MKQKKEKRYSFARETFQRLMKNRLAMFGLFVLCVLVLTAIFADQIAPYTYDEMDFLNAYFGFRPVFQQHRGFRGKPHQTLQGVCRLPFRPCFQHLPDGNQRRNHGRRLEIQVHPVFHHRGMIAFYERVHIGTAAEQRGKPGGKKLPVDHHDGRGQQQFKQAQENMVAEGCRSRPVPHHVPHGEVHQNQQDRNREEKPPFQLRGFMVLQRFRIRPGRIPAGFFFFGSFQRSAVSGSFHGADDLPGGCGSFNAHGISQQADGAGGDTGHP